MTKKQHTRIIVLENNIRLMAPSIMHHLKTLGIDSWQFKRPFLGLKRHGKIHAILQA
jgi:hypothetical protein